MEKTVKNYLILFVILLCTIFLVFYARQWYNTSKEYYANNSPIKDIASEINEADIYSLTIENPKFIIYCSSGTLVDLKKFEGEFKNLIRKMDMSRDILYLNIDTINRENFYDNLKNNYALNDKVKLQMSLNSNSSLYFFSDGKVKHILNNVNELSMPYIKSIFESWGYKND